MEKTNNNNLREQVQHVGIVPCGSLVPDNLGRNHKQKSRHSADAFKKAQAFWAKQNERRRKLGNCSRCGKPNNNGYKRCDKCRAYHSEYKRRIKVESVSQIVLDAEKHAKLVKRIESLELAVAALHLKDRQMYKRGFNKGFKSAERIANRSSTYEPPTISIQELSTMNHAYAGYRE